MAVHTCADSCTNMQHTLMLSGLPFTSRGRAEVIERMRTTELVHHAFMMVKIQQPSTPSTLPPGVLFCLDYRTPPPCPCTSQGSRRRQTTRTRNVLFDCCRPLCPCTPACDPQLCRQMAQRINLDQRVAVRGSSVTCAEHAHRSDQQFSCVCGECQMVQPYLR